MIYAKMQEILSLLLSVQYVHEKNVKYDYSTQPRPCHNFVFMLEGKAIIQSNGERILLKAGNILFIPKNTIYTAQWIAKPKAVFHSLHFSFFPKNDSLANMKIPVQLLDSLNFNHLYDLLKDIERYQFCKDTNSFLALAAFYKLCGTLLHNVKFELEKPPYTTLSPALTYIEQNYRKQFSVQYLADLCFLSPSRFYYLFKEQTGVSPIVYKNRIAIQNSAQELLSNKEKPIREIARNHGFVSPIYFERLFKKSFGKSPSKYRKEESLV
ncbi:MAG: helix-turn-helix domain-containing protein [Clostridia bacterium]|nr:helix-turn-helix domain-containing protein [Clostridia bacterium]